MTDAEVEVLIVGAGPAGLALAVELGRRGVPTRIVDRHPGPRSGSRGCTIWQRTLEVFDLMRLPVQDFLDQGCRLTTRHYHFAGAPVIESSLQQPISPYPQPLVIPQSETERFLRAGAQELGVTVEWGRPVRAAEQDADRIRVTLDGPNGSDLVTARWLVLAQGSRASLRSPLGFAWNTADFGGTELVQVDARVSGDLAADPDESHLFFTEDGTLGCLPLPDGRHRLFCGVRAGGTDTTAPELPEVAALVRRLSGRDEVKLSDPQFAWRVKLYNGIAEEFRRGRALLLGDSAHTVVPVSAQGMNTGIQDAFNLGWKLADAVQSGDDSLIDSYHDERYPVAEALLRRASASYWGGVGAVPTPADLLAGIGRTTQARVQLAPAYRTGVLSRTGHAPLSGPAVGERVDDADLAEAGGGPRRIFDLIGADWTILNFPAPGRSAPVPPAPAFRGRPVPIHTIRAQGEPAAATEFTDGGTARSRYGVSDTGAAAVLIRPDGHLAHRAGELDRSFTDYLATLPARGRLALGRQA